jgi:hypothetical protein
MSGGMETILRRPRRGVYWATKAVVPTACWLLQRDSRASTRGTSFSLLHQAVLVTSCPLTGSIIPFVFNCSSAVGQPDRSAVPLPAASCPLPPISAPGAMSRLSALSSSCPLALASAPAASRLATLDAPDHRSGDTASRHSRLVDRLPRIEIAHPVNQGLTSQKVSGTLFQSRKDRRGDRARSMANEASRSSIIKQDVGSEGTFRRLRRHWAACMNASRAK